MSLNKTKKYGLSPLGFILSAIGAAVGLGNLWGFPTKMLTYGGTAFLIPYIIAILTLGFPMMLLEINLGSKWRKSPIDIFPHYLGSKKGKFFGWMQTTLQMMIGTYYGVIIAWIVISIFMPFTTGGYTANAINTFDKNILGTDIKAIDFFGLGRIQPVILLTFIFVIFAAVIIVSFGIEKGIEKANKFFVPVLFLLIVFIFIYTLNLKGSSKGLEKMFGFDPSKLNNGKAWSTAFGQALFTLSLCEAIIIVFSSNSPKNGDNGNRAITIVAGDTLIALLACAIISSSLGNAIHEGIVKESAGGYVFVKNNAELGGNAFVFKMFPLIFYNLSQKQAYLGEVIGILLYVALFFAAMSTLISLQEPMTAALVSKNNMQRPTASFLVGTTQLMFGIIFTTQNGSKNLIDITDGMMVSWLLLISALIEMGIFVFSFKSTKEIREFHNKNSYLKLGSWFSILITVSWIAVLGVFSFGIYDFFIGDYSKTVAKWKLSEWLLAVGFFVTPFLYFTVYKTFFAKRKQPHFIESLKKEKPNYIQREGK